MIDGKKKFLLALKIIPRNLQMLSLKKVQRSFGLFDPQPVAMAGVNQELELKIFKGMFEKALALAL
jgi:hypothetical protein